MEEQTKEIQKKNWGKIIGIFALILIPLAGIYAYMNKKIWSKVQEEMLEAQFKTQQIGKETENETEEESIPTQENPVVNPPVNTTTTGTSATYKDGSYTAVGNYLSPGGAETIGVTLTLKNGLITDAAMEVQANRSESRQYQEVVAANFKPLVIGKKIDDVKLSKVSGSSLTPKGFNDAVVKIKTQAKS
jgi:uncharacterized protein with FMN-binding domain